MKTPEFQLAETILTDEEATKRFKTVSQLIVEFQKQYFESLKFSLNMWMVINSGVAIALIGSQFNISKLAILGFMLGAISSGVGNMLLFVFSKDCLLASCRFAFDKTLTHSELLTQLSERHKRMYWSAAASLGLSYSIFTISAVCLALPPIWLH